MKSLETLEKKLLLSFQKDPKGFLSFNFYKLSLMIKLGKSRRVKQEILENIFCHPLTKKEMSPFTYLYAEACLSLQQYQEALEKFIELRSDKDFKIKSKLRLDEIKKN